MSGEEGNLKTCENLPLLRIQSDWQDGIRKGEKVWISCYVQGENPAHANILSNGARHSADLKIETDDDDFAVELLSKRSLKVTCVSRNVASIFNAPFATFRNIHKKAVRCVDISAGGSLGISSSDDGTLNIWNTSDGEVRRNLEGHVSDVTHCRFFPSGVVALSGGIDMRLRIWSAENGSCPRVLVGHKAAITDTAIIDKGRNIISCSRDGSAKLWDCGQGKCVKTLVETKSVINSCALGTYDPHIISGQTRMEGDDGDYLNGNFLSIAREDGILDGVDVQSCSKVFESNCGSAINSCCFTRENQIIAGCENGNIFHFDLRDASSPVAIYAFGKSSVNHVSMHLDRILMARGDGSLQILDPLTGIRDCIQLTGPDSDPIYRISCHTNDVFTACRDGSVRKYCLQQV